MEVYTYKILFDYLKKIRLQTFKDNTSVNNINITNNWSFFCKINYVASLIQQNEQIIISLKI